jgi:hypothetical protein
VSFSLFLQGLFADVRPFGLGDITTAEWASHMVTGWRALLWLKQVPDERRMERRRNRQIDRRLMSGAWSDVGKDR